jgi:hypothetical protein
MHITEDSIFSHHLANPLSSLDKLEEIKLVR